MQLQISSPDSAMTESIEKRILAHVKGLEDYVNSLTGCTRCLQHLRFIVLEKAGRVRIHLDLSGGELTIDKHNSVNLPLAITQAFTAARAKPEEYVHKDRHDMKIEGSSPYVRVTTIFPRTIMAFSKLSTVGKFIFVVTATTMPALDIEASCR